MSPILPALLTLFTAVSEPAAAPADRTAATTQTSQRIQAPNGAPTKEAPKDAPADPSAADHKCHWWQKLTNCREEVATAQSDVLPAGASRKGVVLAVDAKANTIYVFNDGELMASGPVATGSEKLLKRGVKEWMFHTPRGRHKVLRKITDPVWTKPDWAFVEKGEPVPPLNSPKRKVKGHLGKYALDLGDGIMIHGTDDPDSLGKNVSHGCIRVGDELLERIYNLASVGTEVWVFEGTGDASGAQSVEASK